MLLGALTVCLGECVIDICIDCLNDRLIWFMYAFVAWCIYVVIDCVIYCFCVLSDWLCG